MSGNKHWELNWGESHSLCSAESWISCLVIDRDVMGNFFEHALMIIHDRHVSFYFDGDEYDTLSLRGKNYLNLDFTELVFRASLESRNQFENFYREYRQLDLPQLSAEALSMLLRRYWHAYRRISACFSGTIQCFTEPLEKEVKSALFNRCENELEVEELFAALTLPTELDIIRREELDLLQLCEATNPADDLLLAHAERHAWYFFNTYDAAQAIAFLRDRISECRDERLRLHDRISRDLEENGRRRKQALEFGGDEIHAYSRVLQRLGHDRLELKAIWSGAEFRFRGLFTEAAARLEVPVDELMWTWRWQEICSALESGTRISADEIELRKDIYLFRLDAGRITFIAGQDARAAAEAEVQFGKPVVQHEIRGAIANPGVVTGRVRKVFLRDLQQLIRDLNTFEPGQIMVTQMTQPTMVSIARRAAAIVTDEGGVMCHAAILAREFGIPCIVGTQIATKAFNDGDLIEVNGNNGICRKLSAV